MAVSFQLKIIQSLFFEIGLNDDMKGYQIFDYKTTVL